MNAEPLGIELVGGPFDGRLLAVQEQVEVLRLPVVSLTEPSRFSTLTYHRCVISEQTKLWRYVFGSHHTTCNTWPVAL